MKYDCSNEFDLAIIYQKLTSPSLGTTMKASNFLAKRKARCKRFKKKLLRCNLPREVNNFTDKKVCFS